MSSRKRSPRTIGFWRQKRSLTAFMENLENRVVLTALQLYPLASGGTAWILAPAGSSGTNSLPTDPAAGAILVGAPAASPFAPGGAPQASSGPVGYIPSQITKAYGVNLISFNGITGDGAGQTIGIFEEGSNPSFVSTSSPNYSTSALAVFDKTFGIPDPPSLNFFDENGNPITPTNPGPGDEGAGPEIALDIEWAHAMAPAANIDVVNAVPQPNDYYQDIPLGMATLAKLPGVSVVSASYGWYLEYYDQGRTGD